MTDPPQFQISKPIFEGARNGVIDCQVESCDWHFAGLRPALREAWNEHYRLNHSQETGTAFIHKNLREPLWLPTTR